MAPSGLTSGGGARSATGDKEVSEGDGFDTPRLLRLGRAAFLFFFFDFVLFVAAMRVFLPRRGETSSAARDTEDEVAA